MTWRIALNERDYTPAQVLAWEHILPQKHIPVLDEDFRRARELAAFLEKRFTPDALKDAAMGLRDGRHYQI